MATLLVAALLLPGCSQGDDEPPAQTPTSTAAGFQLTSASFDDGETMLTRHTCDGASTSPPLTITGAPDGTEILALTVKDHDVPTPQAPNRTITHWVVYDIPVGGAVFPEDGVPVGAREGRNDFGDGWLAPCPPPTSPPHRYTFTVFAIDALLALPDNATAAQLEEAMEGHVIGQATLKGLYGREALPTRTPSRPA